MPNRVCVIDLPGLSQGLLGEIPESSRLGQWMKSKVITGLTPSFPAVTCSVQATLTTGVTPARHGMISNGIPTFRFPQDQALVDASNFDSYRREISFWEQSNQFVEAKRFWQNEDGSSRWKTAMLFFQNSMPGFAGRLKPAADIILTPKPDHGPDGKLVSLCWSQPGDLVAGLFKALGPFPLMNYWGPMAAIASSEWIARAAAVVWKDLGPQLQLVYVPHLDYDLQRFGPSSAQARKAVADLSRALDPIIDTVISDGGQIAVVSEYAMNDVNEFVQPNRLLAKAGLLQTRQTPDGKIIDYENSRAVAMVDHQIAHIYVKDSNTKAAAKTAMKVDGVGSIADPPADCRHRRAGDLVMTAEPDKWFDYRWWSNPEDAPVFARMVDIHRKPGYDPLELFFDPQAKGTQQNGGLVRGSHGVSTPGRAVWIGDRQSKNIVDATEVAGIVTRMLQ